MSSRRSSSRISRVEATRVSWWYFFETDENEKDFQLYHIRTKSSIWSRLVFDMIVGFILILYWPSILLTVGRDNNWIWLAMGLSVLSMLLSNSAAFLVSILASPEQMLSMPIVEYCTSCMALCNMIGFTTILYVHCAFDLCLPMAAYTKLCERDAFPGDVIICQLFLPVLTQFAYPSFSWTKTLRLYFLCCLLALAVAWNSNSYHQIPLLFLAIIFSFSSLLSNRSSAVKSYLLQLDVEDRKEIEQEAKLSERLRLMINGIAHDLKSPLSALSLGCESVYQVYDSAHYICYDLPSNEERLPKAVQLLGNLQEVAQWILNSKQAMSTIISRCVDINQALGGVGLMPTLQVLTVKEELEHVVKHCQEDNPGVQLVLQFGHGEGSVDSIDNQFVYRTDRDWFLENVNCLLQNAIKFNDYTVNASPKIEIKVTRVRRARISATALNSFTPPAISPGRLSKLGRFQERKKVEELEERLRVEVADEGLGVDPETEKILFTFLGHAAQMNVGGAGLGLYTLACRVKALNGDYGYKERGWMQGVKLPGSIFWFEIPEQSSSLTDPTAMKPAGTNSASVSVNASPRGSFIDRPLAINRDKHTAKDELLKDELFDSVLGSKLSFIQVDESPPMSQVTEPSMDSYRGKRSRRDVAVDDNSTEISSLVSHSEDISSAMSYDDDQTASVRATHSSSAIDLLFSCRSETSTVVDEAAVASPPLRYFGSPKSLPLLRPHSAPVPIPPLRILVVDDSMPIRKMCAMILKAKGHIVTTAVNGKDALRLLTADLTTPSSVDPAMIREQRTALHCPSRSFDVVLMDIQMPVMDGIEAAQLYRMFEKDHNPCGHHEQLDGDEDDVCSILPQAALPKCRHPKYVPIIGMSACSDADIINRAIRAGMRDFMSKPFQMQQFHDIIMHIFHLQPPPLPDASPSATVGVPETGEMHKSLEDSSASHHQHHRSKMHPSVSLAPKFPGGDAGAAGAAASAAAAIAIAAVAESVMSLEKAVNALRLDEDDDRTVVT